MENYDDYSFCNSLLLPGEGILWKGRPAKGHWINKDNIMHLLMSLFAVVFLVAWCLIVIWIGAPREMLLFGIVGFVFSVVNLLLFPLRTILQRKNSRYVLTNRKLIRKVGKKVDALELHDLPRVYTSFRSDGTGTISIGHQTESVHYGIQRHVRSSVGLFRLENIPDAAHVYRMMMDQAARLSAKE